MCVFNVSDEKLVLVLVEVYDVENGVLQNGVNVGSLKQWKDEMSADLTAFKKKGL